MGMCSKLQSKHLMMLPHFTEGLATWPISLFDVQTKREQFLLLQAPFAQLSARNTSRSNASKAILIIATAMA